MLIHLLFLIVFSIAPRFNEAMTFAEKYAIWSADLPAGYKIVTDYQDGLRCHCKVPNITTTTTTTTTPASTTTSTASTTTATPTTTTTRPQTIMASTTSTTTASTPTTTTTPSTVTKTPTTTTSTTSTTPDSTTSTTTPTSTTTKMPTTTTTTSPESTTTATTTTTTTATPTTTTSTTSTTPTTTTTTATFTSTTTTTTVIPAVPTTMAANNPCGDCNKTLNIDFATVGKYGEQECYWTSPNYPNNYPDGCVCVLQINLNERGYAAINFNEGDEIYSSSNCGYDYLQLTGDNLVLYNKICDNTLGGLSDFISKNDPDATVVSMTATFIADPGDGNMVAKGFNMTILYELYKN